MEFWHSRYVIPGWIFVGSIVLLSRFLPVPMTRTVSPQDPWNLVFALIGLSAGAPLGYLIYAVVEFGWRLFGGAGRLVNRRRLRSGLLEIYNRILDKEGIAESEEALLRIKAILKSAKDFPDQALYIVFWQSHEAEDFREGCHRRWETVHVSLGIICGFLLAVTVSFVYACSIGSCQEYLHQNAVLLGVILLVILMLFRSAILLAREAANQENVWIELFLAKVEESPETLFKVLQL